MPYTTLAPPGRPLSLPGGSTGPRLQFRTRAATPAIAAAPYAKPGAALRVLPLVLRRPPRRVLEQSLFDPLLLADAEKHEREGEQPGASVGVVDERNNRRDSDRRPRAEQDKKEESSQPPLETQRPRTPLERRLERSSMARYGMVRLSACISWRRMRAAGAVGALELLRHNTFTSPRAYDAPHGQPAPSVHWPSAASLHLPGVGTDAEGQALAHG